MDTKLTKSEHVKLENISDWLNRLENSGHLCDFDIDNIEEAQDCIDGIVSDDTNN